jgi:methyltransferase (TIGR00027 family)
MKADQVSSTALTVIQGILFTAGRPRLKGLLSDEQIDAYTRVLSASERGKKRLDLLDNPLFRAVVPVLERFIEETVHASIVAGIQQVVILGAGFDMIACRFHQRFPSTTFIEIDHPATSTMKKHAIGKTDENFHLIAADLAEYDVKTILTNSPAFDCNQPTLYVCEGVLMYLDEIDVKKLFTSISSLTGVGSQFLFTAIAPMTTSENNTTFLLRWYLNLKKEPLKWTMGRKSLASYMDQQGYTLKKTADDAELLSQYLPSPFVGSVHIGEYLALAVVE